MIAAAYLSTSSSQGGQSHDVSHGQSLVESSPDSEVVVADKGYDNQTFRDLVSSPNSKHVVPRKSNNETGNDDIDWAMYRYRHLVENAFLKIKRFRAVKLARNYRSVVALAFAIMWLPMWVEYVQQR